MKGSKIVWALGGLLVGCVGGGVGTYFFMKTKCEEYIELEINNYIHDYELSHEVENEGAKAIDLRIEGEIDDDEEYVESRVNPTSKVRDIRRARNTDKDVDYTKFCDYKDKSPQEILAESEHPMDDDEEEDGSITTDMDDEEEEAYRQAKRASEEQELYIQNDTEPWVISEEDFDAADNQYEKVGLYYYLVDDVICDDDGSLIENWGLLVGDLLEDSGWIDECADNPSSADKIFIRNPKLSMDYVVTAINEAYFENH